MNDKKLELIGKIVTECRYLCGGRDLNGFPYSPASLMDAAKIIGRLRVLIDRYDDATVGEVLRSQDVKENNR